MKIDMTQVPFGWLDGFSLMEGCVHGLDGTHYIIDITSSGLDHQKPRHGVLFSLKKGILGFDGI